MAKEIYRFRHFSSKVNELLLTYHEDKIRGTSAYLIYEIAGKRILIVFQTGVEVACVQTSPISFHPRVEGNRRRLHAGWSGGKWWWIFPDARS